MITIPNSWEEYGYVLTTFVCQLVITEKKSNSLVLNFKLTTFPLVVQKSPNC